MPATNPNLGLALSLAHSLPSALIPDARRRIRRARTPDDWAALISDLLTATDSPPGVAPLSDDLLDDDFDD